MPKLVGLEEGSVGRCFQFSDIGYKVKTHDKEVPEKTILRGVSGKIEGGNMMCVLGPSGSGKTSLIHIVSGHIKTTSSQSHVVGGQVVVDGKVLNSSQFQRISGLVTQEDVFNSSLTVGETLNFAAALKLPRGSRRERVDALIASLQLEKCRDTYIGDDANPYLKGVSGGEKRRTAIAMELVDPNIQVLVLDEPTSGLDAAAAQNVINVLRDLSNRGMTVMATLHQPRSSIMVKFDQLMVLSEGSMVFSGPRGAYGAYLEADLKCSVPIHESPYDVLLDALNPAIAKDGVAPIGVLSNGSSDDGAGQKLAELYAASELGRTTARETMVPAGAPPLSAAEEPAQMGGLLTWANQFKVLLHRTFLVKLRDPICLATQISSAVLMGLIFGMLYWDTYDKSTVSFAVMDTQMCIVMVTLMAVWLPYDVTLTFPMERKIFLRERKAGLYPTSAFYLARITADVPAHILSAILMALIVHGMTGLNCNLGAFLLINIYAILIGASILQVIGAMSRTFEEANIYMMIILMMSMMLGTGFVREVPTFLQWARDISVMGVVADMGMYLEFRDVPAKYGTAAEIFEEYGVLITSEADLWGGVGMLFWTLVVCRILCYLFVKFLYTGRTFAEDLRD